MPRARNLKYAFFTNDELAEHEPIDRLFFQSLWCLADYKGDIVWRSKKIKALTLPYDNVDIDSIAINLDKSGFIRFYSDGDNIYLNVTNFLEHQNPHKNERDKGSDIPAYSEELRQLIDLKGLAINPDKSRSNHDKNETNRADSFNPIPDSFNPIPDSVKTKKDKHAALAEALCVDLALIKRIVKHRAEIKKPANTDKKIKLVINNFQACIDQGLFQTLDQAMDRLDNEQWQTVKPEYINSGNRNSNKPVQQSFSDKDYGQVVGTI